MEWKPATLEEVRNAMAADWASIDGDLKAHLATYLVEPQPLLVQRFGRQETAFIVARLNALVVYFDDIEDDFWIGREVNGVVTETADYGPLLVALQELKRQGLAAN